MFGEIVRSALLGALPVACFTFLTLQWSITSGRLPKFTDKKDLKAKYKKLSEQAKDAKKKAKEKAKENKQAETPETDEEKKPFFHKGKGGDILHGKVMFFGGGFYGTMALFTYLIIEIDEITSFFGKIIDLTNWRFNFSINFIIDLIINSVMNIVKAFIWFDTLPDYIRIHEGWVWIIAAYLGYLSGIRFTREKGDEAWKAMADFIVRLTGTFKSWLPARFQKTDVE